MTQVVFRKFRDGQIIALFPNLCYHHKFDCESYMHIGQHSSANYKYVISCTKPATESEYKELYNELVSIGYDDLQIIKRKGAQKKYVPIIEMYIP